MREIWILGSYPPPYGGVATFVKNLHDNFLRDKIAHHMVIRSDRNYNGMKLLETDSLPYFFQMSGITPNSIVIDSCNIFLEYPKPISSKKKFVIWNFLVKQKKIKWIKIFHDGTMPYRFKNFGYVEKFILRYSLNNMEKVLTVDDSIRKWLVEDIGYKGEVEIIKSILPRKYKRRYLPSNIQMFIAKYQYIIVSVGTCKREYGFQDIIEALNLLPQEYKSNTGIILIDGNFSARNQNYLETRNKFTCIKNVLLLSKGIDNDLVYSIMKASTVFIRGVAHESYGISRIEAIFAGIPVIATNAGETRGMHIYEYGDVNKLSKLILQVFIGNTSTDTEWSHFYQKTVEENYNLIKNEVIKYWYEKEKSRGKNEKIIN